MQTLEQLKQQLDKLTAAIDRVLAQLGAPASMPASELHDASLRVADQTARLETALAAIKAAEPAPVPVLPIP